MKRESKLDLIRTRTPSYLKNLARLTTDFALQVEHAMIKKGLTQSDLAKKLDKTDSEISKWLSGDHNLTLKSIAKLEDILGEDIFIVPIYAHENPHIIGKIKDTVHELLITLTDVSVRINSSYTTIQQGPPVDSNFSNPEKKLYAGENNYALAA